MREKVWYQDKIVGALEWRDSARGADIELDCEIPDNSRELLRCYGETAGRPLLIGLPEPLNGRLRLRRHLSRETLKTAGCVESVPQVFYLSAKEQKDEPPFQQEEQFPAPRTGDTVLDSLLGAGGIATEPQDGGVILRCPFAPDRPFLLAPAFALCRVEGGQAVLRWHMDGTGER